MKLFFNYFPACRYYVHKCVQKFELKESFVGGSIPKINRVQLCRNLNWLVLVYKKTSLKCFSAARNINNKIRTFDIWL